MHKGKKHEVTKITADFSGCDSWQQHNPVLPCCRLCSLERMIPAQSPLPPRQPQLPTPGLTLPTPGPEPDPGSPSSGRKRASSYEGAPSGWELQEGNSDKGTESAPPGAGCQPACASALWRGPHSLLFQSWRYLIIAQNNLKRVGARDVFALCERGHDGNIYTKGGGILQPAGLKLIISFFFFKVD